MYQEKIKNSVSMEVKKASEGMFAEHLDSIETMLAVAEGEQEDLTRMHQE
jgi:hypothetical protein